MALQRFIVILCGFLLMSSCGYESKVITQRYDNKKAEEVIIYPNQANKKYYIVKHFYRNGKISSIEHFRNGRKEGEFKSWDESGQLTKIEIYKNGELKNNTKN